MRAVGVILVVLVLGFMPLACVSMSPDVYRDEMGVRVVEESTPGSPDWTNPSLKKEWTEGESSWKDLRQAPTTAYSEDQGYMILLRKPKVSTKRHTHDLISDMIWQREKSGD
ncbi:MAG: hypothetical protein ACODAJ_03875 [Planctomycetota bacterium]